MPGLPMRLMQELNVVTEAFDSTHHYNKGRDASMAKQVICSAHRPCSKMQLAVSPQYNYPGFTSPPEVGETANVDFEFIVCFP